MRNTATLSCALVLGLGLATGARADTAPVQSVGFFGKARLRHGLRQALRGAHVNDRGRRSQLTGSTDGAAGAPGMRGMLRRVRSLALDRTLWRDTRFVRQDGARGDRTLHLLDAQRREIGSIHIARSPSDSRQLVDRVSVSNRLTGARAGYRAAADALKGEMKVTAVLSGQGARIQRTERSMVRSLDGSGPMYRMNFGWLTVGHGPRTGYRHRDGKRFMEWPAPRRAVSATP